MTSTILLPIVKGVLFPLLMATSGHSPSRRAEIREVVHLIEFNHHYDNLGRHSYDQVIFYEWCAEYKRFHVIAWCLIEKNDQRVPQQLPGSKDYIVRWQDRDCRVTREVRAPLFRETWSKVDPERANKRLLDEKYRLSLTPPPADRLRPRVVLR